MILCRDCNNQARIEALEARNEELERGVAAALEALRHTAIEIAHHAGAEWVWCAICHKYGRFPSEIEHADDCVFTALEAKP